MAHYKANFGSGMVNARARIRNEANTGWIDARVAVRNTANTGWITAYHPYSPLTVSAPAVTRQDPIGGINVVSGSSTAVASGGVGPPYTFSWQYRSGITLTLSGARTATATFSYTFPAQGGSVSAVYRVIASDGSNTAFQDVNVILTKGQPI